MLNDSPVSQKSVKGIFTGNFRVYKDSAISSVSNQTQVFSSGYQQFDSATTGVWSGNSVKYDTKTSAVGQTTRGAGNGPGFYIVTWGETYDYSYYISQYYTERDVRVCWCSDLGNISASRVDIISDDHIQYSSNSNTNGMGRGHAYPHRVVVEGNCAWVVNSSVSVNQDRHYSFRSFAWHDGTGSMPLSVGEQSMARWTSDGTVFYRCYQTSSGLYVQHYYFNDNNYWSSGGVHVLTSTRRTVVNMVYDKPSNRLLILSGGSPTGTCVIFEITINKNELGTTITNGNAGARIDPANIVQNPNGLQVTNGNPAHLAYMGDSGSYLVSGGNQLYKYDSSQRKFIFQGALPNSSNSNGNGFGGDFSGNLYHGSRVGATDVNHTRSTDSGVNWTTLGTLYFNSSSTQSVTPTSPSIGWYGYAMGSTHNYDNYSVNNIVYTKIKSTRIYPSSSTFRSIFRITI